MKKIILFLLVILISNLPCLTWAESLTDIKFRYAEQKDEVLAICSKIAEPINNIMILSGVSTVSSGVGTIAAGTATVAGIVKWDKDKLISELEAIKKMTDKEFLNYLDYLGAQAEQEKKQKAEAEVTATQNAFAAQIISEKEKSQTLGTVRTAGSFIAGGTSAISAGTSLGARLTVDFDALKKNMEDCELAAYNLRTVRNEIMAEDINNPAAKEIDDIVATCRGFNTKNIDTIMTTLTIAGVISVVGTGTGIAGGITSNTAVSMEKQAMIAGKQSIAMTTGKDGTKDLNFASNVLTGVTTATSLSSGLLTGLPLINLNKNAEIANDCLEKLK